MSLTKRIWISFTLVIMVGLVLSLIIRDSGEKAGIKSRNLVSVALPKLDLIKQLRASITEHERLLYEYYASTTRDELWPQIQQTEQDLATQLIDINKGFAGHVMSLPKLYGDIKALQRSLDSNLSSPRTNWDQARADLALLTQAGKAAEDILVTLTHEVEQQAQQQAQDTQAQIDTIVDLVILYTLMIIFIALIMGYFTQVNIRRTAKRKALAKFPERNPNPVMNLNWQGHIQFANPAAYRLLESTHPGSSKLTDILPDDFHDNLKRWQTNHESIVNFDAKIGRCHCQFSLSLLQDLESCHLYIEDVTERKEAQAQLEFQALHDTHTGLPNRRKFEIDLSEQIRRKQPCSLLFLSIDRFKFITSSQGYHAGDGILLNLGKRLSHISSTLSCQVKSYRLEGNTFCLIVLHPDTHEVNHVIRDIQNAMDNALYVNQHSYFLSLSMGYCHFPQDGDTPQTLISNGHAALNHARVQGNNVEAYNMQLHASEQTWLPIERGMRQALVREEFVMFYQAKVDAINGKITGAEALIRWFKPDGDMVSPATFIPVAEQTGLIIQIGHWVIEQGFVQAQHFQQQGHDIQVAINISARQFQYRHFLEQLQNLLSKTGVNPKHIELEITESLIMENAEHSIGIMKQLKHMGFALAIDDFGTGYSSLSYLKQFPIDSLKIDQAFVRNLEHDEDDKNIVAAIIALAQHLNLKTIAEGVETHEQWQILKAMKCDYIQGYYFSKPNRAEHLLT